mmetsp:Transcript_43361/g.137928  ORF Transcript_43361/g.137928 Transcript_43361/m.137928 type:complete len:386 (-) Transcript_43361:227-1384(-)
MGSAEEGADEVVEAKVSVKKAVLSKAIKALRQVVAKRSANANPLFESSAETMTVLFSVSHIPDRRIDRPKLIELPHPLYDDKSEVCFISKTPQKKYKELLMKQHPVAGLTKVIGIEKLRKKYNTYALKRQLADAFDLFICDKEIMEMMHKLLGSIFYERKLKAPIPVRLIKTNPKPHIERVLASTPLRIPAGPTIGVKFGRCSMSEEELVANAAAVVGAAVKIMRNNPIQSIAVQATGSPALPVWRRPRPPGELVDLEKYRSDASSAASETGASGASETEATGDSEAQSDAMETLSTRDTVSETLSELETAGETPSELGSEAGDVDEAGPLPKNNLPLVRGLRGKRRRGTAAKAEPGPAPSAPADAMAPPPAKKAKRPKQDAAQA